MSARFFLKYVVQLFLVTGLIGVQTPRSCANITTSKSPNFVILLTDDQSWVGSSLQIDPKDDRTKSDYFETPNIVRLANQGMRFTRGYAPAPYCCPTRRSLLIGQTPARHIYQKDQRTWTVNYRRQLSLPRMLKQANPAYVTAHFGKWDMRFDNISPEEMGYDVSDGYTDNGTGGGKSSGGPAAKNDPKQIFAITKRACKFMEQQAQAGRPFFLQVSHYAVHLDIFYRNKSLIAAQSRKQGQKHSLPEFAAMTHDLDDGIGKLLNKIESLQLEDSTYVFFLSDNGGRNTLPKQTNKNLPRNNPLRDGKGSVYEGGIRVPFVIRGPNVTAATISRVPITGLDLFPTIAELAGYKQSLPRSIDGGSLTPVMFNGGHGSVRRRHPFLIFHQAVSRSPETALVLDNFKLVKTWSKNKLELFDLSDDVGEEYDLSSSQPDRVAKLHRMMVNFLDEVGAETRKTGSKKEVYENAKPLPKSDESQLSAQTQPNVLFISIDDLNDWTGALGGHPLAKTPNLDRLIARSVNFSNAHCAAPVCSASRHAVMSGLRPSTTGWYSNSSKKLADYRQVLGPTIPMPTHFKQNGYKTLAAGKIFHKGTSDVAGYDYWTEVRPKFKWPRHLVERGHGYQGKGGGHFYPFPRDGGAIFQKYRAGVSGQSLCWGALERDDIPAEGMPDEQIAAWAVEQLKREHDRPFFLAVGFIRPHVPYTAPAKFFDLYPLKDISVPPVPDDEMDDIPLHGKAMALGTLPGGDHQNVLDVHSDYWREMTRAYLACVSFVDAQAGKVLDALESSPYADNTIVVFWSDHGQHLGEKRHWRKMALWEESTRVPLSILIPRSTQAGRNCSRPVSLIDIYPTLVNLCSLPPVQGLEGESLHPQLSDVNAVRKTPAVTTWHYNNHAVRGPRWRYIRYRDGSEELYNHATDPGEHLNQATNPKFANIKNRLKRFLPSKNVVPVSIQTGGQDSHGRKVDGLAKGGIPNWLGMVPTTGKNSDPDEATSPDVDPSRVKN